MQPLEKPEVTVIPADAVEEDSAPGRALAFLKELTHLMGVEVDVAVGTDKDGNVYANMTGDTLGILIGRRGETLDACAVSDQPEASIVARKDIPAGDPGYGKLPGQAGRGAAHAWPTGWRTGAIKTGQEGQRWSP